MCGFLQSTLLRVPLRLTRSLKSNKADILWCAHAEPAIIMAARARQTAVLWLMRILLVGIIRSEAQNVSRKNCFQPADTFLTIPVGTSEALRPIVGRIRVLI